MDLITLIVTLVVIGFVLWILVTYVPMPDPYRRVLVAIVILLVVLWLLRVTGLFVVPRI